MESGRRGDRGSLRPWSLGLTNVRLIVSRLDAGAARAFDPTDQPANQLVKYDPAAHHDAPLDQSRDSVLNRLIINLAVALSKCIPSVTFGNFGLISVLVGFLAPNMITYLVVYPFCRLVFGTLYPAYASYKAVRTKNLKEYVKWMMYWIVFALFTCTETFTDMFLSWFPFYYEVKIVLVLWLLSPATKGSSILYRKFVHPALCRREQEIDEYIAKAKDQGYHTVLNLGTKGVNYATTVIMQTAIKGGGGLVQQLRKSYSLSDLSECEPRDGRGADEADDVLAEPQLIRRNVTARSGYNTRRSASESSRMYFPEVDVDVRPRARADEPDLSHIKSSEDISSGYSSADNSASLARAAPAGRARPRPRAQLTSVKRPAAAEGSEVTIEELLDDDLEYTSMPPLMNVPSPLFLSHSDPPFIYQYVGDQVRIVQVLGDNPLFDNIANKNTKQVKQDLKEFIQSVEENIDNKFDTRDNPEVKSQIDIKTAPDTEVSVSQEVDIEADEPFYEIDGNNNDVEKKPEVFHGDNNDTITIETSAEIQNNDVKEAEESNIVDIISATKVEDIINTIEQGETKKSEVNEDITLVADENKDALETTSLETSLYETETAESDDEASFGTPEDSPRANRKSPRGRYGKGKAPPPPKVEILDTKDIRPSEMNATESKENLVDIVNSQPSTASKDVVATKSLVVNPISEKKRRHKSKSPNRLAKASSIGKLLQLPGKLAFWHKNDSKSKGERDSASVSSNDVSRRSSVIEKFDDAETIEVLDVVEEYKTQIIPVKADDQISFKDASSDVESEVMGHNIMEKSDALQKLIEAKIESHPEYKITVVAQEIPSPSKSTDV